MAEYVDWFNHRRLRGEIGLGPSAEFEDGFYQHLSSPAAGEALIPSFQLGLPCMANRRLPVTVLSASGQSVAAWRAHSRRNEPRVCGKPRRPRNVRLLTP